MGKRTISKSIRMSEAVYDYVESFPGKSFNDKLNSLVIDYIFSDRERKDLLSNLDRQIESGREELQKILVMKQTFSDFRMRAVRLEREFSAFEEEFKEILKYVKEEGE